MGAGLDGDLTDDTIDRRVDRRLHLHRFEHDQFLSCADAFPFADGDVDHHPRHRSADLGRVVRVSLDDGFPFRFERLVDDVDFAGLAVEFEEDGPRAVGVRATGREVLDDQPFARFDIDGDFVTWLLAVKEVRGRDARDFAELAAMFCEVGEDFGVEQERGDFGVGGFAVEVFGGLDAGGFDIDRRERFAGAAEDGWRVAQDDLHHAFGEAPWGLAHASADEVDHGGGEGDLFVAAEDVFARQVSGDHEEGHVADRLAGRGDFDDIAQHLVDLGVHLADLGPAVGEPQRAGLFVEVGVLAAGHFVFVEVTGRGEGDAFERGVEFANGMPIARQFGERFGPQFGLAFGEAERFDEGVHVDLRGAAREWGEGRVGDLEPLFGGGEDRRDLGPCGVVGVEMDRDRDLLLEGPHEGPGGGGFAEPGHVLDRQNLRPALFEFFGEFDVVLEVVFGAVRVLEVAGVANRRFADAARFEDGVHGDAHVRDPVQGIEDAEDIHPGLGRFADEEPDDVVRVVRVADGVAGPQQHLEEDVGDGLAEVG